MHSDSIPNTTGLAILAVDADGETYRMPIVAWQAVQVPGTADTALDPPRVTAFPVTLGEIPDAFAFIAPDGTLFSGDEGCEASNREEMLAYLQERAQQAAKARERDRERWRAQRINPTQGA